MRTEKNKDSTRKVWLTRDEVNRFIEKAEAGQEQIAMQLMAKIGIRAGAVSNISYSDFKRTSDGEDWLLSVDGAKDTTGEFDGGKQRTVFVPSGVEREVFEYVHEFDYPDDKNLVDKSTRTIQTWVENIRKEMAQDDGDERWNYVSCHDLRRSLVTYLIHDAGVQLSVVQNQMGWDDISTVKNYLDDPSESVMQREFSGVF